jgi:GGDEF domain-containing protein
MSLGAASWDLKIQIILLTVALAGYGLAWLMLEMGRRRAAANAHFDRESGAMHQAAFSLELRREVARAARTGEELCVALVEVASADEDEEPDAKDLRKLAGMWRKDVRLTDVIGRVSERRFGVLLPLCDPTAAQLVVQRLRQTAPDEVRCAAGVVAWNGQEGAESLMRRAEKALAVAKKTGVQRTFTPTQDLSAPGPLPA